MRRFPVFASLRAKRWLRVIVVAAFAIGAALVGAGRLVVSEDPLARADAVYVLGGAWVDRWLEAVDVRREGYAPIILLSKGQREPGTVLLAERGVHVPNPAQMARDVMVQQMGLPASAVEILPVDVDNTAQEASAIRDRARQSGWHRLIVITDRSSTRRAGFAMRRELGPAVEVIVRSPRTDTYDPWRWWRSRSEFRATFYEVPKLVAYWLGLRG